MRMSCVLGYSFCNVHGNSLVAVSPEYKSVERVAVICQISLPYNIKYIIKASSNKLLVMLMFLKIVYL